MDDGVAEQKARAERERRKRNVALALVLGALAALFFLMSIVQWHENFGRN